MAVTLDTLKKSIGKRKVKSMAFAWLADYENMSGDTATALARVDAGLQLYPGDIPGMLVRTKILFQQGNFEECVKECERVLEKDPFCLSAQKRMGEAYEQLENIDERNRCYRRVHDMDPLDTFWKDEYEAVPETVVGAAVAGAVGEALADSEFAMPDLGDENAAPAEEAAADAAESAAETTDAAEPAAEQAEDSLFSKSLDMDIEEAPAEEAAEQPKPYASPFSASSDDDPFAALGALGGEDSLVDESAMDSLQQSLESAMESNATDVTLDQEIPEGEEISGNDVDSAFSSLFGDEDELDTPDEGAASSSPFAQMNLPTSLDDESDVPEEKPQSVFGEESLGQEPQEDKPQSIDDAFGDIFGEDELPEELPASTQAPSADLPAEPKLEEDSFSGGMFEKSAAADMGLGAEDDLKLEEPEPEVEQPEADKPQSLDSAFADIFGEDELPEELPPAQPAGDAEGATDTLAEDVDLELPADGPTDALTEDVDLELPTLDASADSATSLTDDSLDLEMPSEEKLADETPADSLDNFDIANWSPDGATTAEPAVEEEAAEARIEPDVEQAAIEPEPSLDVDAPVEQEQTIEVEAPAEAELTLEPETPTEPAATEDVAAPEETTALADEGFSVDKAFDALFAEEDSLPEEKPATAAEETVPEADKVNSEEVVAELGETPVETAEAGVDGENLDKEELDKEMGAAFSSLFAEDDDLPVDEAKPEAAASEASQEDTGANIEEAPLADASLESDLDKSFSSLFGEDDSLEESPAAAQPAPEQDAPAPTEVAAAAEQSANDVESLESEFSGAFKQLFDTDDDSLDEKADIPSNKGVDFLMSGDSDDEVSAGLVKDPTIPLDKLPMDLDESLNTSTLAEIYFEQGHYDKAIDIYQDLARKEPENESIRKRLDEIEAAYRTKFGENSNG